MQMAAAFGAMSPRTYRTVRQIALLAAMLMSGGALFLPRTPLLLIIVVACFLYAGPTLGFRRGMWPVGLLLFLIMPFSIFNIYHYDILPLVTRYANFTVAALMIGLYWGLPAGAFIRDISPILRLMAWQAAATVAIYLVFPGAFGTLQGGEAVYQSILGIFNYHEGVDRASNLIRPDGFFYEPGVFQIYMNIFLFTSIFVTKRKLDIIYSLGALMLLQSTTGMVTMGLILGSAYFRRFLNAPLFEKLLVALVAPFAAALLVFVIGANINDKLTGASRGSSWAREYDFRTGLNIIRQHPFLGVGFDNDRYKDEARELGYNTLKMDFGSTENRSSSNGLIMLIASLGIPLSLPFFWGIYRQRLFPRPLVFGSLLFLGFIGESVVFTPFFLMIIFSAFLAMRAPKAKPSWVGRRSAPPQSRSERPDVQNSFTPTER